MQQQAQANLSALIESTEDLIWSVDTELRLIACNRSFQKHFELNFGTKAVPGARLECLIPAERADAWRPLYQASLGGEPFRCELPLADGRTLELAFNPIVVAEKTVGVSVFGKDITKRKRVEEALRQSEESLRESQEIAGLGSYEMDIRTGDWRGSEILDMVFGIDRSWAHNVEGWTALLHPDDRAAMSAYFAEEVAGKGQTFNREYRIVRQTDQSVRWVHGLGRLDFDSQGQPLKMRGTIQDITERKMAEMQLRDSEERFRHTFEQAAFGVVHTSFDGRFLRCNSRFAEIVGYSREEVPLLTVQQITAPDDRAETKQLLLAASENGAETASLDKRYIRKDGTLIWVKVTASTQRDGEGRPLHFITFVEDIDARKSAEQRLEATQEALRASEARYRIAFQTSQDGVAINRLSDGSYIDVNRAFLDITGFERQELIGRTSVDLGIWANPADRQRLVETLLGKANCRDLETQFRRKNGEVFWGVMSASSMDLDGVPCILSITRDISNAKAAEDEIRNLAFYDPLTRLPNRRLLLERLRQGMAASSPNNRKKALLFVDLDNFKTLNDTLGHQTGDLLLSEIARRLSACVPATDTLARLGGDEFVAVLENLSEVAEEAAAQAEMVAESFLAAVCLPFLLAGRECFNTASIGITVFGEGRDSADKVLQQADIAMYQAKAAGRNAIRFFSPALQAGVNSRAALEEDLRQALKAKQFVLFYQPQIDSDGLVGVEALVRWKHPRRGLLAPGEFIALAEETGLILPLGAWVLETACARIAAWGKRLQTSHITVAVNISARQFRQPRFVDRVLAAVYGAGANPRNLKLELTESMLLDNVDDVIVKMTDLKSHGLKFSLDDFGTGYSSLSYLKRLPLDQLKIDRSFVRDILTDATSGAIAQTIISLGRAMGLSVIAEGVETEEQRALLAILGCHAFQGFLFSRPLTLVDLEAFLDAFNQTAALQSR